MRTVDLLGEIERLEGVVEAQAGEIRGLQRSVTMGGRLYASLLEQADGLKASSDTLKDENNDLLAAVGELTAGRMRQASLIRDLESEVALLRQLNGLRVDAIARRFARAVDVRCAACESESAEPEDETQLNLEETETTEDWTHGY